MYEKKLRAVSIQHGEEEASGCLSTVINKYLLGGNEEEGARFFSLVFADRSGG